MRILLDTNFLIDLIRFKVDLDELANLVGNPELTTLSSVKGELVRISKRRTKVGGYAKAALEFVMKNNVKLIHSNGRPDTILPTFSDRDTLIATNDIELRRRLKSLGGKTIYLKSKKHLAIG